MLLIRDSSILLTKVDNSSAHKSTAVTTTVTRTSSPTAISMTSSAVTSGTTGIAAFSCNATASDSTFTTSSGASFREECYTEYKPGGQVLNGSSASSGSAVVDDIADFTTYSFQSCIEQCTAYNQLPDTETPCRALSYFANLSEVLPQSSGNCFLKNGRGGRYDSSAGINYALVGSAYML